MTWYHKDFSSSNVYGVNTANAYKYLESKGLKPTAVIVGVLDSGVEVGHPGLIKNMWTNPNEVPNNGKDDDGNGYVDDVHGWNFIGGKNGDITDDNLEVTRVVKKYQPIFEGEDSAKNKANQAKMPEDFAMYMKSKEIFTKKGVEAKQGYETYKKIQDLIPTMVGMLNGQNLTPELVAAIKPTNQEQAMSASILSQMAQDPNINGKSPAEVFVFLKDQMKEAVGYFEVQATKQYILILILVLQLLAIIMMIIRRKPMVTIIMQIQKVSMEHTLPELLPDFRKEKKYSTEWVTKLQKLWQ